jgi:anion-transporting  ArsA/GET3 family ATPase
MLRTVKKDYPFFGLRKSIDYSEKRIEKNVHAIAIDPNEALEEYVRQHFVKPFPLYSAVFKSKTVQNFFDAAPGLKELVTLGKVWQLSDLQTAGKNKYDQVIFDAPSTGHALPIINLPSRVLQMVEKGPFRGHIELVEEFLKDSGKTLLVVVTIPEEMAIKETAELIEGAKSSGVKNVLTVVNCVYPELFDDADERLIDQMIVEDKGRILMPGLTLARSHIRRVKTARRHIQELYEMGAENVLFVNFRYRGDLILDDLKDVGYKIGEQLGASE